MPNKNLFMTIFCLYFDIWYFNILLLSHILSWQGKKLMQLEDILNEVTASDSECEVLSSGGELDDYDDELWELDDDDELWELEEIEVAGGDVDSDDDNDSG